MVKHRVLKPQSQELIEMVEKVRTDFQRLKEERLNTEDAVHRL